MKPIDSPKDIPAHLSDEDRMDLLEKRGVSESFLENVEEAPDDERPRPRTKPINVRFDDFTLGRLKALAASRNVGYQTLLKTFVQERLYEEEKRDQASLSQQATVEQYSAQKHHDWLNKVHDYLDENKQLLEDPELDPITNSRLASNSANMLKEISGEIRESSREKGFPANRLRRMVKAYEKLKPFVDSTLSLYDERFGTEDPGSDPTDDAYDAVKEAERIVSESQ